MNVLWIINVPTPEVSTIMKEKPIPFGGWLVNLSKLLSETKGIHLTIAFPKKTSSCVEKFQGSRISYYSFPYIDLKNQRMIQNNTHLSEIVKKSKPEIVHIFGTEYAHTLSMVNICKKSNIKNIISIQGLVSIYSNHYMASIPPYVQYRFTFRDLLKRDNLNQQHLKFVKRGKLEIQSLKNINHVIGRTTWDRACTTQINSNIVYHHCNENLRDSFYSNVWILDRCERNSIFMSQGSYPIKGLHFMIKAMPIVLERYPDAKLYIGGADITNDDTIKGKVKISSYGKYIKKLINRNKLQNKVIFTGILTEEEMCERYLKSNVFVCPSTIENSPNSLGEAMILGVPCIASAVGGIMDLLENKKEGALYQSDAFYMLAHYICEIFDDESLALMYSQNARSRALKTHDRELNAKRIVEIYHDVIKE
ncbi:glycosyltransferase family 4 protein [Paenibacillus sp. DMB5]|uniref:glycosyltransferase family 4 protein n=1 Tax=Paenibacillus sp. DMB5 TaxID=1780103 RepID=UPI00076CBEBD|nr:glycosyltransferase family 4 protein [Paenibacillus sp. DMB5]KUP22639.1 glycosyl transferase family 1 [Paenibacillus sp. DMB5]